MGALRGRGAELPRECCRRGRSGWLVPVRDGEPQQPERDAAGSAFNRWHLMDLQRFALVPLPTSLGGPAGAYTAWDTTWGTCLSDGGPSMDCTQDPGGGNALDEHPGGLREDDAGAEPGA